MGKPYNINGGIVFVATKNGKPLTKEEQELLGRYLEAEKQFIRHPLKQNRKDAGKCLREAAKFVGIGMGELSDYEFGRKPMPKEIEEKLTKFYGGEK